MSVALLVLWRQVQAAAVSSSISSSLLSRITVAHERGDRTEAGGSDDAALAIMPVTTSVRLQTLPLLGMTAPHRRLSCIPLGPYTALSFLRVSNWRDWGGCAHTQTTPSCGREGRGWHRLISNGAFLWCTVRSSRQAASGTVTARKSS